MRHFGIYILSFPTLGVVILLVFKNSIDCKSNAEEVFGK
jgi:hypothetical protein